MKWAKPDTHWETWFCKTCGSRVPGRNDASRMFVPAGTLSDADNELTVIHHIWVGSKASWDEIGDFGKQHLEKYMHANNASDIVIGSDGHNIEVVSHERKV